MTRPPSSTITSGPMGGGIQRVHATRSTTAPPAPKVLVRLSPGGQRLIATSPGERLLNLTHLSPVKLIINASHLLVKSTVCGIASSFSSRREADSERRIVAAEAGHSPERRPVGEPHDLELRGCAHRRCGWQWCAEDDQIPADGETRCATGTTSIIIYGESEVTYHNSTFSPPPQAFPRKLFEILCSEPPEVIGWTEPGGASFLIKDMDTFVTHVLMKYFRHQVCHEPVQRLFVVLSDTHALSVHDSNGTLRVDFSTRNTHPSSASSTSTASGRSPRARTWAPTRTSRSSQAVQTF